MRRGALLFFVFLLAVVDACAVKNVDIYTRSVPAGQNGVVYGPVSVKAKFGTKPYTWSIGSGSLPTGLSIAGATGIISGTPTVNNTFNFVVHVVDSAGSPTTDDQSLHIIISGSAPAPTPSVSITTGSLPTGIVDGAYSTILQATGGTAPYTWSIPSSCIAPNCTLPPAATLTGATGAITGTLTVAGTYSVTFRVTDSSTTPQTADRAFAITVDPEVAPTYLFSDGFESGNFAAWNYVRDLTDQTVQGVIKHSGSYAEQIHFHVCGDSTDPTCGGTTQDYNRFTDHYLTTDLDHFWVRGYVYQKSPEVGAGTDMMRKLIWIQDANASHQTRGYEWSFVLKTDDISGVQKFTVGTNGSTTCGMTQQNPINQVGALGLDAWHSVELEVQLNTPSIADGVVRFYYDGALVATSTTASLRGTCSSDTHGISFGRQTQRTNYDVINEYRYWDDIIINTTGPIGP